MVRAFKFWLLFTVTSLLAISLKAEDAKPTEEADEMNLPSVQATDPTPEGAPNMAEERQKILQILKTEVEPNLVKGDIDKLQRNVKSLGSYRREWVDKSRETLIANPALAELYLYRFAPLKNRRLNNEILNTILEFNTFRVPRAAVAFASDLARTPQEKVLILRLFEKVVLQDAHLASDVIQFTASAWGQDIPLDERLRFASAICGRLNAPQVRGTLDAWTQSASTFWEKVMAEDLKACLKGS
jgi:hypothetical protein